MLSDCHIQLALSVTYYIKYNYYKCVWIRQVQNVIYSSSVGLCIVLVHVQEELPTLKSLVSCCRLNPVPIAKSF
jgi:hypothetical protein